MTCMQCVVQLAIDDPKDFGDQYDNLLPPDFEKLIYEWVEDVAETLDKIGPPEWREHFLSYMVMACCDLPCTTERIDLAWKVGKLAARVTSPVYFGGTVKNLSYEWVESASAQDDQDVA